jgi:hypothetical protein
MVMNKYSQFKRGSLRDILEEEKSAETTGFNAISPNFGNSILNDNGH